MKTQQLLVVTPTLGTSPWLDETVASVATQGLDVTHVLAAPESQLGALRARYPRVAVVKDAGKAGGIYGAINAALIQAPSEWDWFTYINDDDALLPAFGDVYRHSVASATPAPVVYGDVMLVGENGRSLFRITTEPNPSWIPALLQQGISPLMQQGMVFRRDVVRQLAGFDQAYRLCADLDFWLRAYAAGHPFRYCGRTIANFRLRAGQLSHDTAQTDREQSRIVRRHLPAEIPRLKKTLARWRYRWWNLPRYLARLRQRGFTTSYELLQRGGAA